MSLIKRIGLIIAFVAIAGGIGFGIYSVFFKPKRPPAPAPAEEAQTIGELPSARPALPRAAPAAPGERVGEPSPVARGGLTLAATVASRAEAAIPSPDGRSLTYYDRDSGLFYRTDASGKRTPLSDKKFFNAESVAWAPMQEKAIIEYPDGSNILFDFASQRQVTLPKHWEDFNFSPDGNTIAGKSIGEDPDNRWLIVANPDGSGATPIEPLGNNADKVTVSWSPNNQVVAFSKTGTELGFGREEILPLGFQGENLRGLTVEGFGFQSQWAPDGQRLVYSVYSQETGYRPELWVVDATPDSMGENRRRLNLGTWAEKCTAADARTFYCAVPRDLPEGAGFEPRIAESTPDLIFRVDLDSGSRTLVAEPDARASYSKLILSGDRRTLFLQEANGTVRRIELE